MKTYIKSLLVLLAIFVSGVSASAVVVTFNTPDFRGTKTTTIEDRLINLINHSAPNSQILVSMYDFDRMPLAVALVAASKRGVNVRFVFDGGIKKLAKQQGSAVQTLTSQLVCNSTSCVKYCSSLLGFGNSCRGRFINHHKFVLFSKLDDGRTKVSAVSSENWTEGQLRNANDLIEIDNDPQLYDGLVKYWNALLTNGDAPLVIKGQTAVAYTFPNAKFDPILELLNHVTCNVPNSTIRLIEARFTDGREAVARRLADLKSQGCDVKLLLREEPKFKSPGKAVLAQLSDVAMVLPEESRSETNSIHSKALMIDAALDNAAVKTQMVIAGSHNMNENSLRNNDELSVQISNPQVYQSYLNFWNTVVNSAVKEKIVERK